MLDHKSIAVLPFENMSSDAENEYFSDGMTDEIINALSKIAGLNVTARTSSFAFKNRKVDVRHIGNELGVSTVLEGSIRKSGDRIRITSQLIRTDNGFHIWSENFDRQMSDVFALQDEVSLLIADKVRENFGHFEISDHLVKAETSNLEAYDLYLKGRFHQLRWDGDGFAQAAKYYQSSLTLDNNFALPALAASPTFSYLASWCFMDYEQASNLAINYFDQVSAEHDSLAEFHFAKLTKLFWLDWDFKSFSEQVDQSLSMFPNNSDLLELACEYYTATGQFEQSLNRIDKALAINPLSPNHYYTKGNTFYFQRDFSNAIVAFQKALEIDDSWVLARQVMAICYINLNDERGFSSIANGFSTVDQSRFQALFDLKQGKEVKEFQIPEYLDPGYLPWSVYYYSLKRDFKNAFSSLAEAIKMRKGQFVGFMYDPLLDELRNQEEFEDFKIDHSLLQITSETIVPSSDISSASLSDSDTSKYQKILVDYMSTERPYLNNKISLRELASHLDLHPNKLSWLINERLEKNFSEFINDYRLDHFKSLALNAANKHLTLLGMAYDSGFNSKSVFNEFFKKQTGMTPKAWVKANS